MISRVNVISMPSFDLSQEENAMILLVIYNFLSLGCRSALLRMNCLCANSTVQFFNGLDFVALHGWCVEVLFLGTCCVK